MSCLVYTDLDVDLKGMTLYNTLKEESTNKNHYNDSYSAPFALLTLLPVGSSHSLYLSCSSINLSAFKAPIGLDKSR